MKFEKGTRTKGNKLFWKLYYRHRDMMARCYKESCKDFPRYGGRGVTVCDKWQDLEGFLEDVDKIPGFDKEGILNGSLALDKDKRGPSNLYSLDTCSFITAQENNSLREPRKMTASPTTAISPDGTKYVVNSYTQFAKEHGLTVKGISYAVTKSKTGIHRGWKFVRRENS